MFFYLCWRERERLCFSGLLVILVFLTEKVNQYLLEKNCCIFSKRIATVSTDVPGTYEIFSFSFRCSM
jgi:hypothetical protein